MYNQCGRNFTLGLLPSYSPAQQDCLNELGAQTFLAFITLVFHLNTDLAYRSLQRNELISNPHKLGRRGYFVKLYMYWLFSLVMNKATKDLKARDTKVTA